MISNFSADVRSVWRSCPSYSRTSWPGAPSTCRASSSAASNMEEASWKYTILGRASIIIISIPSSWVGTSNLHCNCINKYEASPQKLFNVVISDRAVSNTEPSPINRVLLSCQLWFHFHQVGMYSAIIVQFSGSKQKAGSQQVSPTLNVFLC